MEAICIANKHAEILFFHRFDPSLTERIFDHLLSKIASSTSDPPPYLEKNDQEFCYVLRKDIYWCCSIKKNSILSRIGPIAACEHLDQFHEICVAFLGTVTQHSIIANIVLLNEIVIETMTLGFFQYQPPEKLMSQIYSKVVQPKESSVSNFSPGLFGLEKSAPTTASQQSLLSKDNNKKEIFIDVIEKVWATAASDGTLLRSEVNGSINIHCYLTNSPTLLLTLNSPLDTALPQGFSPRIHFREVNYGSGVDTSKLKSNNILRIVTKHGESQIANYSLPSSVPNVLPFSCSATVKQLTCSDAELRIKLSSITGMGTVAPRVKAKIAVPPSTKSIMSSTDGPRQQSVTFSSKDNTINWTITDFPGSSYAQAFIRLVDSGQGALVEMAELDFEVSKWVSSGLRIENVELKPNLPEINKWVRYLTTSDTVIFKFG